MDATAFPTHIPPLESRNLAVPHSDDQETTRVVIEQRVYAGEIDAPKTDSSKRIVAVPPATAALLREWMTLVPSQENAWLFASENPETPLRLESWVSPRTDYEVFRLI